MSDEAGLNSPIYYIASSLFFIFLLLSSFLSSDPLKSQVFFFSFFLLLGWRPAERRRKQEAQHQQPSREKIHNQIEEEEEENENKIDAYKMSQLGRDIDILKERWLYWYTAPVAEPGQQPALLNYYIEFNLFKWLLRHVLTCINDPCWLQLMISTQFCIFITKLDWLLAFGIDVNSQFCLYSCLLFIPYNM